MVSWDSGDQSSRVILCALERRLLHSTKTFYRDRILVVLGKTLFAAGHGTAVEAGGRNTNADAQPVDDALYDTGRNTSVAHPTRGKTLLAASYGTAVVCKLPGVGKSFAGLDVPMSRKT